MSKKQNMAIIVSRSVQVRYKKKKLQKMKYLLEIEWKMNKLSIVVMEMNGKLKEIYYC